MNGKHHDDSGAVITILIAWSLFVAFSMFAAAPRPAAQPAIPTGQLLASASADLKGASSGNLAVQPTGAPSELRHASASSAAPATPKAAERTAAPTSKLAAVTQSGDAGWASVSLGVNYLALPIGPGHLVDICGPGGCHRMWSTDAGPDREMQRHGRVADIAVGWWEHVCGVDRSYGLCPVTWTVVGR